MKPSQIRVFDGLRLTSEHLEHLQQSMISAVRDLREIAGADRVYRGLEVQLTDGSVAVQPGLAFDSQKNRIVIDDPQTVPADFADGDERIVCVKYESVEDSEVESHPTIVWDSGSVVVRPALPSACENLIPLAKLVKRADGSKQVVPLQSASSAAADVPRMGLEALSSPEAGFDLRKAILDQSGDVSQWDATLFEQEILAAEPDGTLRCFLTLSIGLSWKPDSATAPESAMMSRTMEVSAHGDARIPTTGDTQHVGMTSVGYSSSQVASSLTRDGIARVDLAPWVSDLASTDAVGSALRPLVVVVRVERGGAGRFRLRASLRFADDRAAGRAPGLDQFAVTMQWEGQFGWSV